MRWPLRCIVSTNKGSDGIIRVAETKTQRRLLKGAFKNLSLLLIEDNLV